MRRVPVETRSDFPRDVFGALAREGDRFRIFVSKNCETIGHRRFTIGHELGHYHLDGHVEALLRSRDVAPSLGGHYRGTKDPYEVEADAFASELLMPHPLAEPVVRDLAPSISAVRLIASNFLVSLSAAAIRMTMLSSAPCVAILSNDGTIEWLSCSSVFEGYKWMHRGLRGEWVPPGSGTSRLCRAKDRVLAGDEDGGTNLLCEWFEGAPTVEAMDECIGLGRYGRVLTVVLCPNLPPLDDAPSDGEENWGDWRDALRSYRLGP